MKTSSKFWLAGGLAATLVLVSGCSGDGGGGSDRADGGGRLEGPTASAFVPDSAGSTVTSFIAYLMRLDPNDEQSEPLLIRDSFAVPPDEVNDSQLLT